MDLDFRFLSYGRLAKRKRRYPLPNIALISPNELASMDELQYSVRCMAIHLKAGASQVGGYGWRGLPRTTTALKDMTSALNYQHYIEQVKLLKVVRWASKLCVCVCVERGGRRPSLQMAFVGRPFCQRREF